MEGLATSTVALLIFLILSLGLSLGFGRLTRLLLRLEKDLPDERFMGILAGRLLIKMGRWFLVLALIGLWTTSLYYALAVVPSLASTRDTLTGWVEALGTVAGNVFSRPMFHLGDQGISLSFLLGLAILMIILVSAVGFARSFIKSQILARLGIDQGLQETLATAIGYALLVIGFLVALELVGIDLSTLAIIAGALSIGIGFGLQNIANNFVSGLIILIERPIKVGDRIEVGSVHGRVVRISARSTAVRTNDNIDIIVPNSELISDRVTNWSQKDTRVRFRVPVGVSYGTDVDRAMEIMEKAAREVPEVLASPAPSARFISFGDSSLNLELRIWTQKRLHRPGLILSDVNRAIYKSFLEHGIQIPFPQADVHIRTWPEKPGIPAAPKD